MMQVGSVPACPCVTVNYPGSPSARARNGHATWLCLRAQLSDEVIPPGSPAPSAQSFTVPQIAWYNGTRHGLALGYPSPADYGSCSMGERQASSLTTNQASPLKRITSLRNPW
jgi:hypothetical protein